MVLSSVCLFICFRFILFFSLQMQSTFAGVINLSQPAVSALLWKLVTALQRVEGVWLHHTNNNPWLYNGKGGKSKPSMFCTVAIKLFSCSLQLVEIHLLCTVKPAVLPWGWALCPGQSRTLDCIGCCTCCAVGYDSFPNPEKKYVITSKMWMLLVSKGDFCPI